ncbi:hypothetical protein PU560_08765 [Georgenia sp. 10Sc9-8]|uniref:Lipoprotein n=1 Tax=Georgenia halotolerans TaxID=3028317 RepID=A0ABT5TWW8_9MICO|nr:hypothetical protein [Georgenia halotolerans]
MATTRQWSWALVLAVLLGGCSPSDPEQSADRSNDPPAGADLSDGSEQSADGSDDPPAGPDLSDGSEQSADGPRDPLAHVDLSDASAAQVAELSDRTVTRDEYEAAFQRYGDCMSAAGFEVQYVGLTDHVHHYVVSNAAVEDGADAECYEAEYHYVDMLWQGNDLVQNARDAAPAAPVMQECLRERGIEPGDTAGEVDNQLRQAGIDLSQCLQ